MKATNGQFEPDWGALNLIGRSLLFRQALALLQQCAAVDATVLLCGETGTGKELAARAIHYLSARRSGPFVPVNCGAIPDSILEAELFGHVRGAYTDAKVGSRGVVGLAEGGTLFLDEVDSLSPRAQSALLRFVQDHSYRALGGSRIEQADLRLVAATNVDLDALTAGGQFRQDLLFRINVLSVLLPPLRAREGDALLLAQAFVHRLVRQYRTAPRMLGPASSAHLGLPLPWPGNVNWNTACIAPSCWRMATRWTCTWRRWPKACRAHRPQPSATWVMPKPSRAPSTPSSAATSPKCCAVPAAISAWPRA